MCKGKLALFISYLVEVICRLAIETPERGSSSGWLEREEREGRKEGWRLARRRSDRKWLVEEGGQWMKEVGSEQINKQLPATLSCFQDIKMKIFPRPFLFSSAHIKKNRLVVEVVIFIIMNIYKDRSSLSSFSRSLILVSNYISYHIISELVLVNLLVSVLTTHENL